MMMKILRIDDLEGAALALQIARIEGIEEQYGVKLYASGPCLYAETPQGGGEPFAYRPDDNGAIGMHLIFKHCIAVRPSPDGKVWRAHSNRDPQNFITFAGRHPLPVAMRAILAAHHRGHVITEA